MIQFQQIKKGDYVRLNDSGTIREGEVMDIDYGSKQICVDNGVQEFWYEADQLEPLPVNEDQLKRLKFEKALHDDGRVKYKKGAFRIYLAQPDNFNRIDLKYREEVRHISGNLYLHELQNHFYDMTKVHLDTTDFN